MRNVRFVLFALVAVSSCRSLPATRSTQESYATGAQTPGSAVSMYMQGMRNVDFNLLGKVWGTREELARDRYSREEFEKRAFVASCYLGWPGYEVTSDTPVADG